MTYDNSLEELPSGWIWTVLGDISSINPKIDLTPFSGEEEVTFLPMKCVEEITGKIDPSINKKLSVVRKGYTSFINGDLLFAKITPCMENGKIAIAHSLKNGLGFGSTEFHVIRVDKCVLIKFIFFYILQEGFRKEAQRNMMGTAGQLRVPTSYLKKAIIPLPPLPEQHRIVARIEELFSRLDAGVEALQRAKAQLRSYRQAVLKAAVEGRLTEEWRKSHPDRELDSAIRYGESETSDIIGLSELPEGWIWSTVEKLASTEPRSIQSGPFGSALHHSEFQDTGILAIGIDNVLEGQFSIGKQHRISSDKFKQLKKFSARPLDVLITVMATVGRCCVVPANLEEAIITKHVYRISVNQSIVNPHYLMYSLLGGNDIRKQIFGKIRGQTRPGINGAILRQIAIPVPSLTEQSEIISEIERNVSIAENMEATIEISLRRADRLRQSILKRAFEGKLIPQDPSDEPASVLLERIRAERTRNMPGLRDRSRVRRARDVKQSQLS
jgi:type I restriction enzyme, S subunit